MPFHSNSTLADELSAVIACDEDSPVIESGGLHSILPEVQV